MTETNTDTPVIYFTRLHWIIFLGPIFALCCALTLHFYIVQLHGLSLILELFAVLWILMTWVTYYFSSVTIQNKQVILRTGVIVRQTVDIPLARIETIDIRQSIIGSILGYGAIIITGTGGTRHSINQLAKPLTCRRYIEQLMNKP